MLATFSLAVNWNSIIIVTAELYKVGYFYVFSFSFPKLLSFLPQYMELIFRCITRKNCLHHAQSIGWLFDGISRKGKCYLHMLHIIYCLSLYLPCLLAHKHCINLLKDQEAQRFLKCIVLGKEKHNNWRSHKWIKQVAKIFD